MKIIVKKKILTFFYFIDNLYQWLSRHVIYCMYSYRPLWYLSKYIINRCPSFLDKPGYQIFSSFFEKKKWKKVQHFHFTSRPNPDEALVLYVILLHNLLFPAISVATSFSLLWDLEKIPNLKMYIFKIFFLYIAGLESRVARCV